METTQSHEDLRTLLTILPPSIAESVEAMGEEEGLLEIVMDLGRVPTARYVDGERVLRESEVTHEEIERVVAGIGDFDDDNRAGIARTLLAVTPIRNAIPLGGIDHHLYEVGGHGYLSPPIA